MEKYRVKGEEGGKKIRWIEDVTKETNKSLRELCGATQDRKAGESMSVGSSGAGHDWTTPNNNNNNNRTDLQIKDKISKIKTSLFFQHA